MNRKAIPKCFSETTLDRLYNKLLSEHPQFNRIVGNTPNLDNIFNSGNGAALDAGSGGDYHGNSTIYHGNTADGSGNNTSSGQADSSKNDNNTTDSNIHSTSNISNMIHDTSIVSNISDNLNMPHTDDSEPKVALPTTIDAVRARRIERALKSRMKMLHQSGPSSFIVQSESQRKYKIIIGPQTCNCNRGNFCVHLLFVMLRVLDVSSRDAILWCRNLKNFEVEQLIKSYEEKAADPKKKYSKRGSDSSMRSIDQTNTEQELHEDEETCPICLQTMEQGSDLVICRDGCNNKLHHTCMETWALEQEKRKERLMCPLCRNFWHDIDSYGYHGLAPLISVNNEALQGPSQDPWLQPLINTPNTELFKERRPIPPQHRSLSRSWVQMFGTDFVKCVFSKEWACRENSLRWLGQLIISLLRERKASVELHGQSVKITTLQECMATLLKYMIMDPVHKVYITALAVTQAVTVFSAPETKSYLSFIFQPVFEAIFIRCTDPTRRTYLNSSDYLVYLCRYDENSKNFGGVDYLFSFSLNTHNALDDWKWWLGRLRVLLRLLTERPLFFTLPEKRDPQVKDVAPRRSAYGDIHLDSTSMHKRLFKIIDFAIQGMAISHFSVRKTGSRVLRESIRRASKDPDALMEIKTLLSSLGRNSNPMLTIYASVLREEALKKQKTQPTTADGQHASFAAKMSIPLPKIEINNVTDDGRGGFGYRSHEPQNPYFSDPSYSRSSSFHSEISNYGYNNHGSTFGYHGSSDPCYSRSSSFNMAAESSPSSSRMTTPNDAPRTLIIESEHFKFDNIPSAISSPASNAPTPDTAKLVTSDKPLKLPPENRSSDKPGTPPQKVTRRTSVACGAPSRGKRKMRSPRPQSLPTMETLFQNDFSPDSNNIGLGGVNNSPSPSEKACSSSSNSGSGKRNLRADEEYELALQRAKQLSLGQTPLPDIAAFQNTDDIILHSPNGTNGAYVEGVHWKRGASVGTGGCSTCYVAWDMNNGQLMCVKQVSFMRNTEGEQNEVIESVREEIGMMRQISHRNIVRLIGAIQLDGHFNIFVEWMPGGSISGLLDKFGPFNEKVLLNYTQQILLAIDYMHTNRFLHRDLKGANCFVDSSGRNVRLGDFGTAAKISATLTPAGQFRGELLGTIAFMAPEVLRGEDYGRPCDIWSVGCCMLEMAEGRPPWNARALTNHLALIYKIASASMSPPVPEHLSPPTRDLINRCLDDPTSRPPASELLTHAVFTRLPNLSLPDT